jgi:glyoxylase-like metal-dependent hydrolase (beta-lactamase superfamily II)
MSRKQYDSHPVGWICAACGTQFAETIAPQHSCPICFDERQYVGWDGQQWLSPDELAATHSIRFAEEDGVTTMVMTPGFAIGQRAFLVPHAGGLVMWECLSLITDEAVARLKAMGGVTAIAISHPHFYSAMAAWSEALGGVPVYLHGADREWVENCPRNVHFWEGERLALADNLKLVRLPGHFDGSAGLWWKDGPRPGGSLLPGDAIQVVMDRRYATFMYSYPNAIPLGPTALAGLESRVADLAFDDVFGFSPGRQMIGAAKAGIAASFDRYRAALAA